VYQNITQLVKQLYPPPPIEKEKKKKDSRYIALGADIMCQARDLCDALQAEVPLHINTCGMSRTNSWVWGKMMV